MAKQTSFVDALKAKYCDDGEEENGGENFIQITVFGKGRRRQRPPSDSAGDNGGQGAGGGDGGDDGSAPELEYLKNVVLFDSRISHAAIPPAGLSSLCPNVIDLDLSGNLLDSWGEVLMIFQHLPRLKFVNLSSNPLANWETCSAGDLSCGIEDLVLNDTRVSWDEVFALARFLPKLKQLHLCKNEYTDIGIPADEDLSASLSDLKVLALNNNHIRRWDEIAKLRSLPHLHTLVLLENPLEDVYYIQRQSASLNNNESADITRVPGSEGGECTGRHSHSSSTNTDDSLKESLPENSQTSQSVNIERSKGDEVCSEEVTTSETTASDQSNETSTKDSSVLVDELGCNLQNAEDEGSRGGRHLETKETEGDVVLAAVDPQYNQSKDSQPVPEETGDGATIEDAVRDTPGYAALKHEDDVRGERDGMSESVQPHTASSGNPTDIIISNLAGVPQPASDGASVTNCQPASPQDQEADLGFVALESLCVTGTALSDWQHLQELQHFPRLHSVKMKNIPLLESWDEVERRKVAVACLPSIKRLNGSEITAEEREKAERHFVRLFADHTEPPPRHNELVQKYGKLMPLHHVDIGRGFQEFTELSFIYGGRCIHREVIRMTEPVSKLKKYCGQLIDKHHSLIKMYHKTRDPDTHEVVMDELFLDSLPLSRFNMEDGDEVHIDVKAGPENHKLWQPGLKLAP